MKVVNSRWFKGVVIVSVVVLIVLAEQHYQPRDYLSSDLIAKRLEATGSLAAVVFVLVMATAVVVSPIPSLPLTIAAGSFFGPVFGTLYASIGGLLGAVLSFLIARFLGRELIGRMLRGHINFCQDCSDKLLTTVVFVSRLLPVISFDVVSYGAGLTKISLVKFSLATFFGMLPLTFFYVSFGSVIFENRAVSLIAGAVFVALFFFLPRWIERHNFLSVRKHFQHSENPPL